MQSDRRAPPKPRFSTTVLPNWPSRPFHKRTDELPTNTTAPGRGGFMRSIVAKSRMACAQRLGGAMPSVRSPAPALAVHSSKIVTMKRSMGDNIMVEATWGR